MSTQCSFCKAAGHNMRTCVLAEMATCLLLPESPKKRKTHCCSICGESGHNSQKCELRTSPKAAAVRHCKACGETGHNIRTCLAFTGILELDQVCSPCSSPCSSPTYKRRTVVDTHTITGQPTLVEDTDPDFQLSPLLILD
jgi:hypothetical protein